MTNNGTLKSKLLAMREGEVLVMGSKDLANLYCGGKCPMPSHIVSPYHKLQRDEKAGVLSKAYRELILALRFPPDGFDAEELTGPEFRIQFVRLYRRE